MDASGTKIKFLPHHEQQSLCTTRPPYRQGKKLTAVKVYTVNDESSHLLIHGVPSIGLLSEVSMLCERYGRVKSVKLVDQYSSDQEEFTNIYHVQFVRIQSARFAKKILDNKSFFGGVLHVCYAPELETIHETKLKLVIRKREVAIRTRYLATNETDKSTNKLASGFSEDSFKSYTNEDSLSSNQVASNVDYLLPSTSQDTGFSQQVPSFAEPIPPVNAFFNAQPTGTAYLQPQIYGPEPPTTQNLPKISISKAPQINKNVSNSRKRVNPNCNSQSLKLPRLSQETHHSNSLTVQAADKHRVPKPSLSGKKNSQNHVPSSIPSTKPPDQPATVQRPSISKEKVQNSASKSNAADNNSANVLKRPHIGPIRFLPRSLAIKKKK